MLYKRNFNIFWLSIVLFGIFACGDSLNLSGITETSEDGLIFGNVDENDWCSNRNNKYRLLPAFPNPADGSTTLHFELDEPATVKILVINNKKKIISTLLDEMHNAGVFQILWKFIDSNGNKLNNGLYRVQFFANDKFVCHGDVKVVD